MFLLMAIDDGSDDAGQVAMRLDFVQLTGLDERRFAFDGSMPPYFDLYL